MCSRYQPPHELALADFTGGMVPTFEYQAECCQGYDAPIVMLDAVGGRLPARARFGMLQAWQPIEKKTRNTFNAPSERVAQLATYRNAWKKRQLCLIPAQAFYEPSYESGKAEWWRIHRADGQPFALAGIWESKLGDDNFPRRSFSMLTIDGAGHPIMQRLQKPHAEKRSVVVVPPADYERWLAADDDDEIRSMLRPFDPVAFVAAPASRPNARSEPSR